jgi:hypothetical protein
MHSALGFIAYSLWSETIYANLPKSGYNDFISPSIVKI